MATTRDLASELERHIGKLAPPPHGDTPSVMRAAADELRRLTAERDALADPNQPVTAAGLIEALTEVFGGTESAQDCLEYAREWTKSACRTQAAQIPGAKPNQTWRDAANWLRNNYQDHPNIASLCDAMVEHGNKQ